MPCIQQVKQNGVKVPNKWKAIVRISGQSATKIWRTKKEAENWGMKKEIELREGKKEEKKPSDGERSFSDTLDKYLLGLRVKHHKSEMIIERDLEHWRRVFGPLNLASITTSLITDEVVRLAGTFSAHNGAENKLPTKVGPATVNRKLAHLSIFFTWASKEHNYIPVNPCRNVKKLKEPRGRTEWLTPEERESLFHACRVSTTKMLYPIVVICCYTGARQSEILNLQWQNVDLLGEWLTIPDSKNGEPRRIPLKGPALAALKEWRARSDNEGARFTGGRVFPKNKVFPDKAWYRALKLSGVLDSHPKGFVFHDTRHTAASYLIQSNVGLLEVATILGHKDLTSTRRYSHLSPEKITDSMETMIEKFG